MSLISAQVEKLRNITKNHDSRNGTYVDCKILEQAADTIEFLSAKLAAANMERSERYYIDEKKLIAEMTEEIENFYGKETELTERARDFLLDPCKAINKHSWAHYGGAWVIAALNFQKRAFQYCYH